MKSFWMIPVLSILFVQSVLAAAPSPDQYAFEQKLNFAPVSTEKTVKVTLNEDVLRHTATEFENFQVLNDLNGEAVFVLHPEAAGKVKEFGPINISSGMKETPGSNLLDDNRLTEFAFDQKVTSEEPATVFIDFGKIVNLHRLESWVASRGKVLGMEIRGGVTQNRMKTIRRKSEFKAVIDTNFPPLQFLEISFWGSRLYFEDILFYQKQSVDVYFTAQPDRRYRILYGNPKIKSKRYKGVVHEAQEFDIEARTANGTFNPLASDDFDDDGVINEEDNCFFVSNKSQNDEDSDGVGDKCDNAKAVKNFAQSDVDNDGIGDIIDNCKLEANPDQKDKDRDGIGDVCDAAPETKDISDKAHSTYIPKKPNTPFPLFVIFGLILAAAGYFGYKKYLKK